MVQTSTWVSVAILLVLIVPTLIFFITSTMINIAEYTKGSCDFPQGVCQAGNAIGFPMGWLNTQNFLWFAIIPLIGVWLTVYGFMSRLRFFSTPIMAGLSFVIAFSTIPLGLFVVMVVAIYQLMGFYAIIGLAILFFVGVFFQVRGGVGGMSGEYASYNTQIKQFQENEKKINTKIKILETALKQNQEDLKKQKNISQGDAIQAMDDIQKMQRELKQAFEEKKLLNTQLKRFKTLASKYKKLAK